MSILCLSFKQEDQLELDLSKLRNTSLWEYWEGFIDIFLIDEHLIRSQFRIQNG